MRRQHRAGEALEVDYAGMTLSVIDKGVVRQAQVFVACLPCSDLTYAEASWTQGHEDWLGAPVRAFAYIGGCPKKVIPDNLKTGVTDANYWDPVLNRSYHALGRHHNVAIVPARVRKPRDKPSAENAVRLVEMWVLEPLRHRQFFSLAEANAALAEKGNARRTGCSGSPPDAGSDIPATAAAVSRRGHAAPSRPPPNPATDDPIGACQRPRTGVGQAPPRSAPPRFPSSARPPRRGRDIPSRSSARSARCATPLYRSAPAPL